MGLQRRVVISDTLSFTYTIHTRIPLCIPSNKSMHVYVFMKHHKMSHARMPSALLRNLVFSHVQIAIHQQPSMASYYEVGVRFCSINGGSRSQIHPRNLQTHIRACFSQQLCFFRAHKTGLYLSRSNSVDYRPDRRQVSQEHIALSVASLSLLACCPLHFFFIYPQTGCIYHLRSLAALFFPAL